MAKEHRGFLRRYLGLAIPISFQFLMWAIVPACDAFMLGRSYRKNYHRDFEVSVSFGADDAEPLSCSSREFAYA